MGDMGDDFRAWDADKKERKAKFGIPCPDCKKRLPKAHPKILMPNQKCWCGYRDKRERNGELMENESGGMG